MQTSNSQNQANQEVVNPDQNDSNTARDPKTNSSKSSSESNTTKPEQETQKKTVSIVLVDASVYESSFEIRAYVSDIVENNGACTFTFTSSGGMSFSRQTSVAAGANSTSCTTLNVPVSEFNDDNQWTFDISYKSPASMGTLTQQKVALK